MLRRHIEIILHQEEYSNAGLDALESSSPMRENDSDPLISFSVSIDFIILSPIFRNRKSGSEDGNNVSSPRGQGREIEPSLFSSGYIKASSSLGSSIYPEEEGRDKKFKVLIVEDSKNLRATLRMLLESKGYNIVEAGDGQEALKKLADGEFDLIISDFDMPKIDGIEFLAELKNRGITIPVIMRSTDDIGKKAYAAGAKEFIPKQRPGKDLLEIVNKILKSKAGSSPVEGGNSDKFILIVENNNKQRRRLKKILNKLGHKVVSAHNGEQAWDIFMNEWRKISLVITDLDMPRLDGEGFIRRVRGYRVRKHSQASRIKIMVISRRNFNKDKFGSEIDQYELKPKLTPVRLKEIIVKRFKLSSSALILSVRVVDFTSGQGISYGCCVRTVVRTEEKGGRGNFMEAEDFKIKDVYELIAESYMKIFGLKSAVLFSHSMRVFCRGPP